MDSTSGTTAPSFNLIMNYQMHSRMLCKRITKCIHVAFQASAMKIMLYYQNIESKLVLKSGSKVLKF
jgi:hypothetical protein